MEPVVGAKSWLSWAAGAPEGELASDLCVSQQQTPELGNLWAGPQGAPIS